MMLNYFHTHGRSAVHTPRMIAGFALLFALLLGTLPLNARLVLRHGEQILSPTDTVNITVVEQRTEYPSNDPNDPKPFTVIEFKYPDIQTYTVGTDNTLTAPLDFTAEVKNDADFALEWCGLTYECNVLPYQDDYETREASLTPTEPRLPLELQAQFEEHNYGDAIARLTLTAFVNDEDQAAAHVRSLHNTTLSPTSAVVWPRRETTDPVVYTIRFTYPVPTALRRVATPLPADAVLYDLAGRRVVRPRPGHIYLRAGRKVLAQ